VCTESILQLLVNLALWRSSLSRSLLFTPTHPRMHAHTYTHTMYTWCTRCTNTHADFCIVMAHSSEIDQLIPFRMQMVTVHPLTVPCEFMAFHKFANQHEWSCQKVQGLNTHQVSVGQRPFFLHYSDRCVMCNRILLMSPVWVAVDIHWANGG
jgi:hypothetical protein